MGGRVVGEVVGEVVGGGGRRVEGREREGGDGMEVGRSRSRRRNEKEGGEEGGEEAAEMRRGRTARR